MFQWQVIYPDGRYVTNEEARWEEISTPVQYEDLILHILNEEAASLTAFSGLQKHTLRSPSPGAQFYRYFQGRTSLGDGSMQVMYHAIGCLSHHGRIQLEIDPAGNTAVRVYPLTLTNFLYEPTDPHTNDAQDGADLHRAISPTP